MLAGGACIETASSLPQVWRQAPSAMVGSFLCMLGLQGSCAGRSAGTSVTACLASHAQGQECSKLVWPPATSSARPAAVASNVVRGIVSRGNCFHMKKHMLAVVVSAKHWGFALTDRVVIVASSQYLGASDCAAWACPSCFGAQLSCCYGGQGTVQTPGVWDPPP